MRRNKVIKKTEGDKMDRGRVKINVIRAVILVIALVLVVVGLINGGYIDVLNKAIRICYECIGIG